MYKKALVILAIAVLFVGCGNTSDSNGEVLETTEVPLHEISEGITWDGLDIKAFTPVCAFESTETELQIFPHYNNTAYINVVKMLISDKAFWKTVSTDYVSTNSYIKGDGWDLITLESGTTLAYIPLSEEYAYFISSSNLPSGYVEMVAKSLCELST